MDTAYTLYIDSRMGISGVKLLGALIDILESPEAFVRRFNELGFDGIRMNRNPDAHNGITGSVIAFERISRSADMYDDEIDDEDDSDAHHRHHAAVQRRLSDVKQIIDDLPLNGKVRKLAAGIYDNIASAAAKVKGESINDLILHRTGSRDVIASVVGVCILMDELEYGQVIASPVAIGNGYAETSRGKVPIPIPALQVLLDGIPYSAGAEDGETCTLEGAALLKCFADTFQEMPELTIIRAGAGFGMREYSSGVNCVRAYIGKIIQTAANAAITELEAVLYSDNAQSLALAAERLEAAGASDAYTMPIASLRGGRGFVLKCICPSDCADAVAGEVLRNTSAESVRRVSAAAYKTEQKVILTETSIGKIAVIKTSGFGVSDTKPVPGDIAAAARANDLSYAEAYDIVIRELQNV